MRRGGMVWWASGLQLAGGEEAAHVPDVARY